MAVSSPRSSKNSKATNTCWIKRLEEYKPKIFISIIYDYIIKTLQNSVALLYYLSWFCGLIDLSWEFCSMWCQMKLQSFGSPLGQNIQDGTLTCLEFCWGWLGGGGQKWAAGMAGPLSPCSLRVSPFLLGLSTSLLHVISMGPPNWVEASSASVDRIHPRQNKRDRSLLTTLRRSSGLDGRDRRDCLLGGSGGGAAVKREGEEVWELWNFPFFVTRVWV